MALVSLIRVFVVAKHDQTYKIQEELGKHNERLSLVEMKMGVFWRLCEEHLGGLLKRPIHLEMDALLDKYSTRTLTIEECERLQDLVQREYLDNPEAVPHDRLIATLVLGGINAQRLDIQRRERREQEDMSQ